MNYPRNEILGMQVSEERKHNFFFNEQISKDSAAIHTVIQTNWH